MTGDSDTGGEASSTKSTTRDELRTISFRLREMQRLMGVRVMQENTRLEAEGLAPITENEFFEESADRHEIERAGVADNVERLGTLDLGQTVRITLLTGRTIAGEVGPIDYTPGERLRLEVEPEDASIRYEVKTRMEEPGWTPVTVRRYHRGDDDWASLGVVRRVTEL